MRSGVMMMQFECCEERNRIAGSVSALLSEDDTREIFSMFGDKCLSIYHLDIRQQKSFMNAKVLRQVKGFVSEYGVEDSKRILERLFGQPYNGSYKGRTIGTAIFSKGYRWLANNLLMERMQDEQSGGVSWSKW